MPRSKTTPMDRDETIRRKRFLRGLIRRAFVGLQDAPCRGSCRRRPGREGRSRRAVPGRPRVEPSSTFSSVPARDRCSGLRGRGQKTDPFWIGWSSSDARVGRSCFDTRRCSALAETGSRQFAPDLYAAKTRPAVTWRDRASRPFRPYPEATRRDGLVAAASGRWRAGSIEVFGDRNGHHRQALDGGRIAMLAAIEQPATRLQWSVLFTGTDRGVLTRPRFGCRGGAAS